MDTDEEAGDSLDITVRGGGRGVLPRITVQATMYPLLPRGKNTVYRTVYYTVKVAGSPKFTVQFILPFYRTIRYRACSGCTGPTIFSKTCTVLTPDYFGGVFFWRTCNHSRRLAIVP